LKFSDITDPAVDALREAGALVAGQGASTVRLGVTGLSRAGKTVFVTSLVRNLVGDGRLPFSSRSRTTRCRALPTRIIWRCSQPTRRFGLKARGASAS
jgi:uncharacterized protein